MKTINSIIVLLVLLTGSLAIQLLMNLLDASPWAARVIAFLFGWVVWGAAHPPKDSPP